jgi:hypothetical protein
MECSRCAGLVVYHQIYDHHIAHPAHGGRCIQCGDIFDPVILDNRGKSFVGEVHKQNRKKGKDKTPTPCAVCGEMTVNPFTCSTACAGIRWGRVRSRKIKPVDPGWGSGVRIGRVY